MDMSPLRYWARITISANPKKRPRTSRQLIGIFIANFIICLIVSSITLMSHIIVTLLPATVGSFIFLLSLIPMLYILFSLLRRMYKVKEWRKKTRIISFNTTKRPNIRPLFIFVFLP